MAASSPAPAIAELGADAVRGFPRVPAALAARLSLLLGAPADTSGTPLYRWGVR